MLDKVLSAIKDSSDYLTALSLFQDGEPMTKKEAQRMLEVYAKYVPGAEEPGYARVCLAVDLLPGRTEKDRAYFAALELGEDNLDALFGLNALLAQNKEITRQELQGIAERVRDESLELYIRVILARTALNTVGYSRAFGSMRAEISALAEFLTGCGSQVLDRSTELAGEVHYKCRQWK